MIDILISQVDEHNESNILATKELNPEIIYFIKDKSCNNKADTLKKYYDKYEDIYLAVNECKELRRKLEESKIEYNGERLTITEISRKARSK